MKALKITLGLFLAVFIFLILIFLMGPRVDMTVAIEAVDLPADLDAYLQQQESQFSDLKTDTEKSISWAGEPGKRTEYVLVYLHGFSATRQETTPLTENVAQILGANVFQTRFQGHGRSNAAMAEASINGWLNDAHEAMEIARQLGDKIIVIGVSTGGTVATWLAANDNEGLAGLILMSPNFGPKDSRSAFLTWPWGKELAYALIGPERSWQPDNALHAEFWTYQYPTEAVLPMMGLVNLVNEIDLGTLEVPALWVYSENDQVLNVSAIKAAFERYGANRKENVIVNHSEDRSQHVLAGDILSPNTTAEMVDLITSFIQP